jgi:uncharacterized membrane protein
MPVAGQVDPRCARVVTGGLAMKAHALVPALALAAALLAPPLVEAQPRHRPDRGHRPPAHGYYGHSYRAPRPYYRSHRYYYAPAPYYGYGYGAYGYGGYGHYPPPPPRYCPPRPRVGFWFGF